jgi:hypothetical protein
MQQLLAQFPDPTDTIANANRYSWEAGLLAMIVICGFAAFGWTIKIMMTRHLAIEERTLLEAKDREIRLSTRVSALEDLVRTELLSLIKGNSETMGKVLSAADSICRASDRMVMTLDRFTSVLDVRPCLLSTSEQLRIVRRQQDGMAQTDEQKKPTT